MAREKKRFTSEVIKAIEELEMRRARRSQEQLAEAGWQKLQYDLPVVEVEELQALLQQLSSSLQGKTSWPSYCLTHKALENITAGARRGGSYAPVLPEEEQQQQQLLAASLSSTLQQTKSPAAGASSQPSLAAQAPSEQELYQQLTAVLLLQYAAKVVSVPEQSAWQLLASYQPEHSSSYTTDEAATSPPQQQQLSPALPDSTLTDSTSLYEVSEAAVPDEDDEAYEALEEAPSSCSSIIHTVQQQQQEQEQYSWQALKHKLQCLADSVHYSLMSHESVWREQAAASHLLQLLRAVGVHCRSEELQPMLHVYVGLLVDRLVAEPAQLPLLQQLWEALGLASGGAAGASQPCLGLGPGKGLPPEAVLGFSVAAAVWQQLPAGCARNTLWQMMHQQLLPMLEQCSEQLAYHGSSSKARQQQEQQGACSPRDSGFAHVLLLGHVVELLLLGRPVGVDVSAELTSLGVTRNMVQLFVRHAADPGAEPLRRAVLFACCASPTTASWVLAVPAVLQQLEHQQFQPGHAAEAHGAVWQMLLSRQGASRSSSGSGSVAGGSLQLQCEQLLGLLVLPDKNPAAGEGSRAISVQHLVVCLQLLVDVQAAAGRPALWDQQVVLALRRLAAAVKAGMAVGITTSASAGDNQSQLMVEPGTPEESGALMSSAATECSSGGDDDDHHGHKQASVGAEQSALLAQRQEQNLLPQVLKLIKQLLTQGGKTD